MCFSLKEMWAFCCTLKAKQYKPFDWDSNTGHALGITLIITKTISLSLIMSFSSNFILLYNLLLLLLLTCSPHILFFFNQYLITIDWRHFVLYSNKPNPKHMLYHIITTFQHNLTFQKHVHDSVFILTFK